VTTFILSDPKTERNGAPFDPAPFTSLARAHAWQANGADWLPRAVALSAALERVPLAMRQAALSTYAASYRQEEARRAALGAVAAHQDWVEARAEYAGGRCAETVAALGALL